MKKIRNFFLIWIFIIIALLGLGTWFVNAEFGNNFDFIRNQKTEVKLSVITYFQNMKNDAITSVLVKMGYNQTLSTPTNQKPEEQVIKVADKPQEPTKNPLPKDDVKVAESPKDNQPLVPEVKSEFTHMSIPFFYDHSSAPKSLSKEQVLGLVSKASDTWNTACNISFDYKGDRLTDYIDVNNTIGRKEGLVKWGSLPGSAIGQAHQGNSHGPAIGFVLTLKPSFFATKQGNDYLYATVLHELGHVIGLDHSKNPTSIMFWQQSDKQQQLNDTDKTMCKYFRARWSGMSMQKASDKYGILVNENSSHDEIESNAEEE